MTSIHVTSEIGKLKKVLLHRPGKELLNMTPGTLETLLFDDIPYLKNAQQEHDEFARTLRENDVEVVYLVDLMAETLNSSTDIRTEFINELVIEGNCGNKKHEKLLIEYLSRIEDHSLLVEKAMAGVRYGELKILSKSLIDYMVDDGEMILQPMPNLYFTRDPFAMVGHGVVINHMHTQIRHRETIFGKYIFKYHPIYSKDVTHYYHRDEKYSIEGGDVLNLNEHTIAIGISARTEANAIEKLAENIFADENTAIDTVLAFDIPKARAFMHLDTVFTQIDVDKFTVHPGILGTLRVFELRKNAEGIQILEKIDTLENILTYYMGRKIELIHCGGNDPIAAEREQWNDGSNTLCISPGKIIVYDRNIITNALLKEKGLQVLEISSGEISRGRGGPRCMSMPLIRE